MTDLFHVTESFTEEKLMAIGSPKTDRIFPKDEKKKRGE